MDDDQIANMLLLFVLKSNKQWEWFSLGAFWTYDCFNRVESTWKRGADNLLALCHGNITMLSWQRHDFVFMFPWHCHDIRSLTSYSSRHQTHLLIVRICVMHSTDTNWQHTDSTLTTHWNDTPSYLHCNNDQRLIINLLFDLVYQFLFIEQQCLVI